MTFDTFKATADEILERLKAQKNDARTEFLHLLITSGYVNFRVGFSLPKTKEEER